MLLLLHSYNYYIVTNMTSICSSDVDVDLSILLIVSATAPISSVYVLRTDREDNWSSVVNPG